MTPIKTVEVFSIIANTIIVAIKGNRNAQDHVVIIWNKQIIDFDSAKSYPLCVQNINLFFGKYELFNSVTQDYLICVTKKTKYYCKEHNIQDEWYPKDTIYHLIDFLQTGKKRKCQKSKSSKYNHKRGKWRKCQKTKRNHKKGQYDYSKCVQIVKEKCVNKGNIDKVVYYLSLKS